MTVPRFVALLGGVLLIGPAGVALSRDGPPSAPAVGVPAAEWTEPTLCTANENVVWSCRAKTRTISVCASRAITATSGYMQYRAGKPGKLELQYPETPAHPRGRFRYTLYIQGNESLEFSNKGYDYSVVEDLRSADDGVYVMKDGAEIGRITCNGGGEGFHITRPDLLGMADTPYGN